MPNEPSYAVLRALVQSLPGGAVFVVDRDLKYLVADGSALRNASLCGADFVGKTVEEMVEPALAASAASNYRIALAGEPFITTHGSHGRTYLTRGAPLRDKNGVVFGAMAISYDVTDERMPSQSPHARTGRVHTVPHRLKRVHDYELRSLAREIHDDVGQSITALRLHVQFLQSSLPCPRGADAMAQLESGLAELDRRVDALAWRLRGIRTPGKSLTRRLDEFVSSWAAQFKVDARFTAIDSTRCRLDEDVQHHLCAIARESLHNVHEHARAKTVRVLLQQNARRTWLIVQDNGIGFDRSVASSGLGLRSMQERADLIDADFEISSSSDCGTRVVVSVPHHRR